MGWRLSPVGNTQWLTPNGQPYVGAKLFTYQAGTSTKVSVATSANGTAFHTNPIILNAIGMPPTPIYIDATRAYKFVYAPPSDTDPPTSPIYTIDEIVLEDVSSTLTQEWLTPHTVSYVNATTVAIAGDVRELYHVGRRVKLTALTTSVYATIINSIFDALNTVLTLSVDAGGVVPTTVSMIAPALLSASGSSWPGGYSDGVNPVMIGLPTVKSAAPGYRMIHTSGDWKLGIENGYPIGYRNTGNEASPVWTQEQVFVPTGSILPYAHRDTVPALPAGWLLCDGQAVSRVTYARLFAVIGVAYGPGDGSSTFNVPDLRGRFPLGFDGTANRVTSASVGGSNADTMGGTGGAEVHFLQVSEMPSHTHRFLRNGTPVTTFTIKSHDIGTGTVGGDGAQHYTIGMEATGGGLAHNTMPPWQVVHYIIKT
jgi:microcystin-dependent protein